MTIEKPYFMSNKEWYYLDAEEYCYKLTDKATDKAKESYKKFYDELNGENEASQL